MTEIQILKWALDRVVLKGFRGDVAFDEWYNGRDWDPNTPYKLKPTEYYDVIFSHAFAKAFFGEQRISISMFDLITPIKLTSEYAAPAFGYQAISYLFHLQQMATFEKPLQYLAKFYEKHI